MNEYFLSTGLSITLGNKISGGGEGDIFEIAGRPQYCAKIYHLNRRDPIRHQKIKFLVVYPPPIPDKFKTGIQLAWPTEIIYDQNRVFAGFVMRRFSKQDFLDIENYFHYDSRSYSGREFTWKNSLEIASYIAFVVSFLHNAGYRVGDLKGSNLWVSKKDCSIIFLDCDSFQVTDSATGITYFCTVGTPEYTPPELFGKDLGYSDRYYSDLFALGTLIFQILMEGAKPYSARGSSVDDAPSYSEKIKKGLFPYGHHYRNVSPPKESLPWEILSSELQDLCVRCFVMGSKDPKSRPQAIEWAQILYSCSKQLKPCTSNQNHFYLNHSCPWCDQLQSNHIDYYPGNTPSRQQMRVVSLPPVQKQINNSAPKIPSLPTHSSYQKRPVSIPLLETKKWPFNKIVLVLIAVMILIGIVYLMSNSVFSQGWRTWGNDYGKLDTFGGPGEIAVDDSGNVYVQISNALEIGKISSNGKFLTKYGGNRGTNDGEFMSMVGVAVDTQKNVYGIDEANNRIQKFTSDGKFLTKWGSAGTGDGQFKSPSGIAVDNFNNVYIIDAGNSRVQKFTSDGKFLTKWGTPGNGDGQFSGPSGIAIDKSGNVYVLEVGNSRVQKFTSDGKFLTKWGTPGNGDGQFNDPYNIAIDNLGNVYVTEPSIARIQKFTSDGIFITKWDNKGSGDGQFNYPTGIVGDKFGNVYVSDSFNNRIQKFSP